MDKELIYQALKEELDKCNNTIEVREQWDKIWSEVTAVFYEAMADRLVELETIEHPENYDFGKGDEEDENDL